MQLGEHLVSMYNAPVLQDARYNSSANVRSERSLSVSSLALSLSCSLVIVKTSIRSPKMQLPYNLILLTSNLFKTSLKFCPKSLKLLCELFDFNLVLIAYMTRRLFSNISRIFSNIFPNINNNRDGSFFL